MMQIVKVLFELYRHFDFQLVSPEVDWTVCGSWLTRQTDMDMVLSPVGVSTESKHELVI